jgi:hypothetical protein
MINMDNMEKILLKAFKDLNNEMSLTKDYAEYVIMLGYLYQFNMITKEQKERYTDMVELYLYG